MATGSDDFKVYLWEPQNDKKPIARMDGHLQTVNQVS
jgi:ribosome assembly protein 4